jgi:NitT/TauT family transport system ATP-binding protein
MHNATTGATLGAVSGPNESDSGDPVGAGGYAASEPYKITATDVSREFVAGKTAVHAFGPLTTHIADGELVCIVGPSGCGKSTFLRIMAGLLRPSAGEVSVRQRSARTPTAMVFQDYGIFPWKTVEANVRFGLDIAGTPKAESRERVSNWLARLGLTDFAKAYPSTLSGGMRQRVAIARALAVEPEVLLMDEPFAALDAQMRLIMQDELLKLWEADRRTLVFVTHSLDEAILLGDRVLVMSARPGRIIADIKIPFERPRSGDLRGTPRFAELQSEIWDLLRVEVEGSMRQGNAGVSRG